MQTASQTAAPEAPELPQITPELITDVLATLERHGYHKVDTGHTGQAVGLIFKLAKVYSGRAEW